MWEVEGGQREYVGGKEVAEGRTGAVSGTGEDRREVHRIRKLNKICSTQG